MTIEEAQKLVDNWIKEKGVRYFNELTNTTILMEEVGELARVIARKYGEQSTKKGEENLTFNFIDYKYLFCSIPYGHTESNLIDCITNIINNIHVKRNTSN